MSIPIVLSTRSSASSLMHRLSGLCGKQGEGRISIFTSELTLLEVLVKPMREKDAILEDLYRRLLMSSNEVSLVRCSAELLIRAASIRARTGLKTPDAIHAASSVDAGCAAFITNDPGFRTLSDLSVLAIEELTIE